MAEPERVTHCTLFTRAPHGLQLTPAGRGLAQHARTLLDVAQQMAHDANDYAKGVRCSDCQNPHSAELKAPGNGVCLQCHNTAGKTAVATVDGHELQAKNYAPPEHTRHAVGEPGSFCVDCHMPGKFFSP